MISLEDLLAKIDTWARYKWKPFDDFWRWRFVHGARTPDLTDITDLFRRARISRLVHLASSLLDRLEHAYREPKSFAKTWDYLPRKHRIAALFDALQFARRHQMGLSMEGVGQGAAVAEFEAKTSPWPNMRIKNAAQACAVGGVVDDPRQREPWKKWDDAEVTREVAPWPKAMGDE